MEPLANLPEIDDDRIKDDVYDLIERMVQRKMGGRKMGRAHAKAIFEGVVDMIFRYAVKSGQFRFPKGYGTLLLRTLAPTRKRLPSGDWVQLKGGRAILRYNEGLAVRQLLGKRDKYPARKSKRGAEESSVSSV